MDVMLLLTICGLGYLVAYHTYGKYLAKKVFKLDANAAVPSRTLYDGIDYVPSHKKIVFGHHFTTIAGTGPIVGPAIGLIWGWLPAILWVTLGCIFMGAVHDFGAMVISLRNEGRSISDIAARYIHPRIRLAFFLIVFFVLLIVIAIFGVIMATMFDLYPESVAGMWLQIPIAMTLGWAVYKKNIRILPATVVAMIAMLLCVMLGPYWEATRPGMLDMPTVWGLPPTGMWTLVLLGYCFFASTLPVTTLLQPRDYLNAWQLYLMMGLLAVGVVVSAVRSEHFHIAAPAYRPPAGDVPGLFPMMFVTIACGAISGFHSLAASGTSPKQIACETDSLFIGFGSMLLEGMLAVLVIACIVGGVAMGHHGLFDSAAVDSFYASGWMEEKGLGIKLQPVVVGSANIMERIGIVRPLGFALMGVFICSFAGTTLDSATRIQRYVIAELAESIGFSKLSGRYTATAIAVFSAAALAFIRTGPDGLTFGANGAGAQRLWPLLGTANQLLAALALLVITMYLKRHGGFKYLIAAIPCGFILVITTWAMVDSEQKLIAQKDWLLAVLGGAILAMAAWMTVETILAFFKPPQLTTD